MTGSIALTPWRTKTGLQLPNRPPAPGQDLSRLPLPPFAEDAGMDPLLREYLQETLKPLQYYSMQHKTSEMDEEGSAVERVEAKPLYLLDVVSTRSRPHLIPTIQTKDDVTVRGRFAVDTQELCLRPMEDEGDAVQVFPDVEPVLIS